MFYSILLKSKAQIGRLRVTLYFFSKFCWQMSPQSAEARYKGILYFLFKFVENEPQIGRRPIKRDFIFNFDEKWVLNRPKADKERNYILHLIFLKNDFPIGRRPIKKDFIFFFVVKWASNRSKADKRGFFNLILL